MTGPDPADLLGLAHRLADAAGAAALPFFRRAALATGNKAARGWDPVTEADRAAERAMRAILEAERPDDAILGEEEDRRAGRSGLTWILDPIDGTRAFVTGLPLWTTLIGLYDEAGGRIGLIDQPFLPERFVAQEGHAELRRPDGVTPLRTRPCPRLSDATLLVTTPEMFGAAERAAFDRVAARVRTVRWGTDAYGYAMVAAGHADLVVEAGLGAYDIAGPAVVVRAAGGVVTTWSGEDPRAGGRIVAAGDPALHAAVLSELAG